MDIKKIVTSSTLAEKTQQNIIFHYERIKEGINSLEEDQIEAIKEEDLLGEIEYLIKSIAEHTLLDDLKKEMTTINPKIEEMTILNFRLGDNGLKLLGFGEDSETFMGSCEIEARTQIQLSLIHI